MSSRRHLCLLFALATLVHAQESFRWTFDDKSGTSLAKVASPAAWSNELDQTATTGRGTLRIRRSHSTEPNTYVALPTDWRTRPLWLVARVRGWNLSGRSPELVRLGFSASAHEKSPLVVAQVKFARDGDSVRLSGEATGEGATTLNAINLRGAVSNRAVTVALYFDPASHVYRASYRVEGAAWQALGEGVTNSGRTPKYLRLGVQGPFDTSRSEYFDLDDLLVSPSKPADVPDLTAKS